ncbi:MAG TPA: DNA recombination protein RmuC [Candidatus Magasanikbacteria bacterium]|nr:DNA recombination protein RmuC [Candidatus Magasanikbacteria bacterium]
MNNVLLGVFALLLLGMLAVIILMYKKLSDAGKTKENPEEQKAVFLMFQQQLQDMQKTMDMKISETHKIVGDGQQNLHHTLQTQFAQSSKIITDITEKLTTLDKTNQQVIGFSSQLSDLEKVLKHQKQRGNLGEVGLQLLLENILSPNDFKTQHHFNNGDIVDVAIFTKEGIIPVDAKFSLDNYERLIHEPEGPHREQLEKDFKNDLKKRIDETAKYIKPDEGTLEFAFMYIPSEAIYYDLLVNEVGAVKVNTRNLIDYAFNEKKVVIVSPTTFSAYLQTVLFGLRALKIEEGAKMIRKNVEMLGKHINAYDEYMKKLGLSMSTTVNHFNTAYKELGKIDKDVVRITGASEKVIVPDLLDKPQLDS